MEYLEYYPPVIKEIYEIQEIAKTMDFEFEKFQSAKEHIKEELFILTVNNEGLKNWEHALNIETNSNDTVDLRRFRILSKLNGDNTSLKKKLNLLLGEGNYIINIYPELCKLQVIVKLISKDYMEPVKELLEKVVPMNIELDVTLAYNTHNTLSAYTHNELSNYTHKQLIQEVL